METSKNSLLASLPAQDLALLARHLNRVHLEHGAVLQEPECPVEAIFSEEELPAGQEQFKQLNADLAKQWPVITEKKDAPPDAKEWEGKPDKLKLLER